MFALLNESFSDKGIRKDKETKKDPVHSLQLDIFIKEQATFWSDKDPDILFVIVSKLIKSVWVYGKTIIL